MFALDTVASARFILVVLDSIEDIDRKEDQYYGPDDEGDLGPDVPAWPVDGDTLLDAALVELGLHAADTADWFGYRAGTPD